MINKLAMKQYGFIKFSDGMNQRQWINDAKQQGYRVLICFGHAELWK